MSDLNSRETAATVVEVITRLVERGISKAAPEVRYGVVVNVTTDRKVDVLLLGQPMPSTGFVYGSAVPAVGDRVRCVIDPRGDRYVADVLGRDAVLGGAAAGSISTVSLDSGTASTYVARAKLTADTAYRVSVGLDASSRGDIDFGDGTAAPDVNLYRAAADTLATDDNLRVAFITGGGISIGTAVAAPSFGIAFGSDTRLYRTAAASLKTDGGMVVAGTLLAGNIAVGNVSITPVANTPTSVTVTGLAVSGTTLTCTTSASTAVPGSAVTETSYASLTSTGVTIYVYRTNTTATTVSYQIIGV